MPRVPNDHVVVVVAPLRDDGVAHPRDGTPEHIQARPEIANARRGERPDAVRQGGHDDASARMSFSTPAAVTAGPAPGPVMMSGFVWYRIVVNATWLSVPLSAANGLVASTAWSPTSTRRFVTDAT